MGMQCTCDLCEKALDNEPQMTYVLDHGGLLIDFKIGIHNYFNGCICVACLREKLKQIAEQGIFVHRKITLPETIPFKVAKKEAPTLKGWDPRSAAKK